VLCKAVQFQYALPVIPDINYNLYFVIYFLVSGQLFCSTTIPRFLSQSILYCILKILIKKRNALFRCYFCVSKYNKHLLPPAELGRLLYDAAGCYSLLDGAGSFGILLLVWKWAHGTGRWILGVNSCSSVALLIATPGPGYFRRNAYSRSLFYITEYPPSKD
jgi:hypothetical protein